MIPGFLMATLNPGRTKRRRKTRRKLSAWQRLVKKAGGVLQAVKMRAGRKSKSRGRRRRNPFLSTSTAAVAPLMNGRRRRKKNRTRRSAVQRRRLRSRSRSILRRRPKMAKVRRSRRRRVVRGKGGRFKSRSSRRVRRSRRTRRNPVVPVSWNPRRKRRRSRRNPLFLSKRGFSGRKHKGYRRLHRRRHSPRFWHNPVVPISWNPRKRRGGRRRSYRNNPVLPYFAMNPGNAVGEVLGKLKSMVDISFWTETGLPVAVGFFGSKVVGNQVMNFIPAQILSYVPAQATPFVKAAVNTLAGASLSWAAGRFVSKKAGDNVWLGTVVGVSADLIKTLIDTFAPGFSAQIGLSGLGSSLDERMKDAITQRVRNNLNGYLTVRNVRDNVARPVNGLGATYVTTKFGRGSYDPTPRLAMAGDIADDSTQL